MSAEDMSSRSTVVSGSPSASSDRLRRARQHLADLKAYKAQVDAQAEIARRELQRWYEQEKERIDREFAERKRVIRKSIKPTLPEIRNGIESIQKNVQISIGTVGPTIEDEGQRIQQAASDIRNEVKGAPETQVIRDNRSPAGVAFTRVPTSFSTSRAVSKLKLEGQSIVRSTCAEEESSVSQVRRQACILSRRMVGASIPSFKMPLGCLLVVNQQMDLAVLSRSTSTSVCIVPRQAQGWRAVLRQSLDGHGRIERITGVLWSKDGKYGDAGVNSKVEQRDSCRLNDGRLELCTIRCREEFADQSVLEEKDVKPINGMFGKDRTLARVGASKPAAVTGIELSRCCPMQSSRKNVSGTWYSFKVFFSMNNHAKNAKGCRYDSTDQWQVKYPASSNYLTKRMVRRRKNLSHFLICYGFRGADRRHVTRFR